MLPEQRAANERLVHTRRLVQNGRHGPIPRRFAYLQDRRADISRRYQVGRLPSERARDREPNTRARARPGRGRNRARRREVGTNRHGSFGRQGRLR